MLYLLAIPVIVAVAFVHRHLQVYAPSNVLIRRVRASHPSLSALAMLVALVAALLVGMAMASRAAAAGAPGWLNLVVLLLGWDAIKIGWLAIALLVRCVTRAARRCVALPASRPAVSGVDGGPIACTSRG